MLKEVHNQYSPDFVTPPGETLQETLEAIGMSQAELAERTGRPKKTINEIIKGKAAISPETALQLERVLGVPASFWNSRERQYREDQARVAEQEKLKEQVEWLARLPINAMVNLGWIKKFRDKVQQLLEVLTFFGVASPQELQNFWDRRVVNFRMSPNLEANQWTALAWLRKGEIEAKKFNCPSYDLKTFRNALSQIRALTISGPETFHLRMISLCADSGVAVVLTPEIPGIRVSGAARWLTPAKAMIQLNLRYKTNDHFWFTFFHEAAHILKHDKRLTFIEELPTGGALLGQTSGEMEEEANRFAANFLIPAGNYHRLIRKRTLSKETIKKFADDMGIAPGIVVGRLQHDGHIPYNYYNDLKLKFEWVH
jgi:HTH-type transcriptional regulator/antitoxin HigA